MHINTYMYIYIHTRLLTCLLAHLLTYTHTYIHRCAHAYIYINATVPACQGANSAGGLRRMQRRPLVWSSQCQPDSEKYCQFYNSLILFLSRILAIDMHMPTYAKIYLYGYITWLLLITFTMPHDRPRGV